VTNECYDRHGKAEFLDFIKKIAKAHPRRELHVVLDNYHTHKHDDINHWLVKNPRVTLHFTPTSGSWLNLVEVFFGIITRQAIRRGDPSTPSSNSSARSAPSSTAGTIAATPSPGQDRRQNPAPRHPYTRIRRATLAPGAPRKVD
jgi:transposase